MFDLVIKDAEIHDGSGAKAVHGDLGVKDGRIAAIGPKLGAAKETVKADGLALAPGIIDGHTHYDAQITWDPFVDPSPALGVTTAILGNCGFTIAPCKPADRDLTMRHLTHVEGMSLDALRAGINWGFESFPQYLDMLEKNGVGPNVACFAGHSAIRTFVMGTDATERAATEAEVAKMADLVREAMKAGAIGFASSTSEAHNGEGGTPMPSRLADDHELRTLGEGDGPGRHRRLHADQGPHDHDPLSRGDRRRIQPPGGDRRAVPLQHQPRGRLHHAQPGERGPRARPRAGGPDLVLPAQHGFHLPAARTCSRACRRGSRPWRRTIRPSSRRSIAIRHGAPRCARSSQAKRGRLLFNGEWEKLFVVETAKDENRAMEGATLAELAKQAGKDPFDFILDFALSENLDTMFVAQLLHNDDKQVGRILADPNTHISLSDAGAHLTFFCDAGFGLHLMGHWSRDLGVLDLPNAVHRLTGQPAKLFGIQDRGFLREGLAADLMLFDPKTVARGPKRRAHDLPAGAARLTAGAIGLHGVWINGAKAADEKGFCADPASRPGKVLRSFAA